MQEIRSNVEDDVLKDQVIKIIEYILDNTIPSGRDYEIYCIEWKDIINCWLVAYVISWVDKNGMGHMSQKMFHITQERIYEIYNSN